jgi:cyclophilin family peptidyl-prolyl cis-trans isomerase
LEDIKLDIGSKRKSAALDGVKKARAILSGKDADKMVASCRDAKMCQQYITEITNGLNPLAVALQNSMDSFQGSEQERAALDAAYAAQQNVVNVLTNLEEQMIPAGYVTPVPNLYNDLPQLRGRATVEMTLVKPDKSNFKVEGELFKEAKMTMIIDGYTAPVTGGNFVDLVQRGFYNNMEIQRSDGFVVQTGDPSGEAVGFVGSGGKAVGNGPKGERLIPLEIFVKGDKGPFYESTIEDEGRGGQATVLPFSSYGAMGWAREEYDPNSGSSQFFWLLFDSDLTPAGKNVLDGRYPCFGYVVEGADFLSDIKEGDIITSAKVTKGLEQLVLPK